MSDKYFGAAGPRVFRPLYHLTTFIRQGLFPEYTPLKSSRNAMILVLTLGSTVILLPGRDPQYEKK